MGQRGTGGTDLAGRLSSPVDPSAARRQAIGDRLDSRSASDRPTCFAFAPEAPSVRSARRFAEALCAGLSPARRDDVLLCVSELVTNVIVHTSAPGELRVGVGSDGVRLEVDDASAAPPELAAGPGAVRAVGGRGLRIIDQLAVAWGHVSRPGGKTVWVQLPGVPDHPG